VLPGNLYETQQLRQIQRSSSPGLDAKLTAAEIGTAHHEFLRLVALERTMNADSLHEEALRLLKQNRLTPAQAGVLDFDGLSDFWNSELGQRIRARQKFVHRELDFTARFSTSELASMFPLMKTGESTGEFVLVQGVADLAVIAPGELWLVDFKTDQLDDEEVASRVRIYESQLNLYALALSRIYRRPVCESWLYFLGLRRAIRIESASIQTGS
jgi:ATP-dependent helicase/nuclease subunit A